MSLDRISLNGLMKCAFFRSLLLNGSKFQGKQKMLSDEKNCATFEGNRRATDNNEKEHKL